MNLTYLLSKAEQKKIDAASGRFALTVNCEEAINGKLSAVVGVTPEMLEKLKEYRKQLVEAKHLVQDALIPVLADWQGMLNRTDDIIMEYQERLNKK